MAREAMPGRCLWREPFDRPAFTAFAPVEKAVMQPVLAALPELDGTRNDPISAPVRRARHGVAEAALCIGKARLERGTVGHGLALRGGPCSQAAAERAQGEIFVGFRGGDFLDRAF